MPELPEVETVARGLREGDNRHPEGRPTPPVLGRKISGAQVLWPRTLAEPDTAEFGHRVVGQRIETISRRGKYIVFHLTEDYLLVHLRMTGDLYVEAAGAPVPAHHRLILELDESLRLAFNDVRKFGRIWLVDDPARVVGALGPEPLSPNFRPGDLHALLQSRKRQLKPALLDQQFIAGLGNIYVDEALHRARLHPLVRTDQVDEVAAAGLWKAIRNVLEEGLERNGASIDWAYRGGEFQNEFRVYQRTGEPCPRCGTLISRILVGQRGTHLCPNCQRL